MVASGVVETVRQKYQRLRFIMDERMRRRWAACEALALPHGGITAVAQATGLCRTTIWAGIRELQEHDHLVLEDEESDTEPLDRIRHPGGGRYALADQDPTLLKALEGLVDPLTRGDPQSPLRWTCKSTRTLAEALGRQGYHVCHRTVASLLHDLDYSLQANRKTREGTHHPDRNAQFEHINAEVQAFQRRHQPVISVDAKKKENIGDFKNPGQEWQPHGCPEEVRSKDFKDKKLGKVNPYGVYDLTCNDGWVSVGVDHDTAAFATETMRRWWQEMGQRTYPQARELLVTADCGGSNSYRCRLWKVSLQHVADETGLRIHVCHFPPGTSKWNKIEHRMFCHITHNWRGRPLTSRAVVVSLIGSTKTKAGLQIEAALDTNAYPTGIKVSDEELATVQIKPDNFHGEWNYTISPKPKENV
jgi:hypothetical protein